MILPTTFTFIVERSWKNTYFHLKLAWPPATGNHSNWPSLNLSQNLREGWTNSYWKRQLLMFYPLGKNSEKPHGGGGIHPSPPPLDVRGLKQWFKLNNPLRIIELHANCLECFICFLSQKLAALNFPLSSMPLCLRVNVSHSQWGFTHSAVLTVLTAILLKLLYP